MHNNIPYGIIGEMSELGHLIRQRRREFKVTQAKLAGLAGVGLRFLSELERGKPTAELGKALQVLTRLGLNVWILPRGAKPEDPRG